MADENQGLVALETKVSDLEKKQGDFDALTARLDKLETKPARPDAGEKKDEVTPERKAFAAYLVRGDGISDDDKKALNQSIDLQGGFLAPAELSTEVIRALVEYNPMRSLADVRPTTSPSTIYQTRSDLTNAKWVGETQTREESEITFGQTEIAVKELATFVDISNRLLADAPQAETEVRLAPAEDFGGKEAHGFLWGQGVLEPNGLMVDPAIASTANGHATALSPDALIIFDCGWQ
ncbi:phage major capsid protein [Gemmobacter megaterium]|nr:phage major capsid protein [Gemmobacter megaterium]